MFGGAGGFGAEILDAGGGHALGSEGVGAFGEVAELGLEGGAGGVLGDAAHVGGDAFADGLLFGGDAGDAAGVAGFGGAFFELEGAHGVGFFHEGLAKGFGEFGHAGAGLGGCAAGRLGTLPRGGALFEGGAGIGAREEHFLFAGIAFGAFGGPDGGLAAGLGLFGGGELVAGLFAAFFDGCLFGAAAGV